MLKENNCHLAKVDKDNFNRILRDVEANSLRLQENGKDVLILERVAKQRGHSAFKYENVLLILFAYSFLIITCLLFEPSLSNSLVYLLHFFFMYFLSVFILM